MKRCSRCGQPFQVTRIGDFRCPPCHRDVQLLVAADARRRVSRFSTSKDLTGAAA
jgi:uncharacterized Zn finger protein (UPF0148 family)